MKWYRIKALLIRHLYLFKRSPPRIMDILFWPVMELILWGLISLYLSKFDISGVNIITFLLGAIIFWDLLSQGQRAVSLAFLEDVWEKNLLNIFVTPLKPSEFVISTGLLGAIRIVLVGIVMSILAAIFYSFNIFTFGFLLIPFALNLLLFGFSLGLLTVAIILRYGTSAQILAFGMLFLIQPISAVFYPVAVLPHYIQWISKLLPSTHVFEGMRAVASTGIIPVQSLLLATGLNIIYLAIFILFFYKMFAYIKRAGRLLKLD